MENLKTKGEWGFLNQLLPRLRRLGHDRFAVSPGDDAAVLRKPSNAVLSIDGLTEGTHFKSRWSAPVRKILGVGFGRALGWKLLGSGLSDLAAMGRTTSRWAMVYLAAPPKTNMVFLTDLYLGVKEACASARAVLVGGDTVRGRDLSLVVAVGGEMLGRPLVRSGARPGDALCVVGTVGDAQMGLKFLLGQKKVSAADRKYFLTRFFRVQPRFKEADILAHYAGVTSLMDLSDPLGSSVGILTAASKTGAIVGVEDVPVSPRLAKYNPTASSLLSAGEDYGLLFTVRRSAVHGLKKKLAFKVIGQIRSRSEGVRFYFKNKQVRSSEHFEHFA